MVALKKIPLQCIIRETCFMSISFIGEKLYIGHLKNMNHVHTFSKNLVPVIITLGKYISRGDTFFFGRVKQKDLEKYLTS